MRDFFGDIGTGNTTGYGWSGSRIARAASEKAAKLPRRQKREKDACAPAEKVDRPVKEDTLANAIGN
jgi:hypothetical protein